jgi:type VI secretion system protein ImpK
MTALALPDGHAEAVAVFRRFHTELAAIQAAIARGDWSGLVESGEVAAAEPAGVARAVFARLCRAVVTASAALAPQAGRGAPVEPGYVIAAFADEALLTCPPWPGQAAWPGMLLEEGLYGSRIAGERLFEVAETLLAVPTPRPPPLVSVLLLALTLGFRGRWRGIDDGGAVARLAGQLHASLFRGAAPSLAGGERVLAETPLHVLLDRRGRRLPSPRRWLLATFVLAVLYVAASQVLWRMAVDPVLDLARIIALPALAAGS